MILMHLLKWEVVYLIGYACSKIPLILNQPNLPKLACTNSLASWDFGSFYNFLIFFGEKTRLIGIFNKAFGYFEWGNRASLFAWLFNFSWWIVYSQLIVQDYIENNREKWMLKINLQNWKFTAKSRSEYIYM